MIKFDSGHLLRTRGIAYDILDRWRDGKESPNTNAVIHTYPEVADRHSLVLELALEEYCLRHERGEVVDKRAYCTQFPHLQHSLARQIETYEWLAEQDDTLEVDWPQLDDLLLGRYHVVEELGRGALARAYLCDHVGLDRLVVVKVARRGEHEARMLAKCDCPTIMPVLDLSTDEFGWSFLAMPFLGRNTLQDLLDEAAATSFPPATNACVQRAARRGCAPYAHILQATSTPWNGEYITAILRIADDISSALAYAHQRNIVHSDVKPTNVLLRPDGRALLMDFNLAAQPTCATVLAGGTIPYMAPEQLSTLILRDSHEEITPAADIFAMGVISINCSPEKRRLPPTNLLPVIPSRGREPWWRVNGPPPSIHSAGIHGSHTMSRSG